jgi:hypothetical protein
MHKSTIHVYAVCKNEIEFLPFFIQYYKDIADKIVIYDNESTDGSREFIEKMPNCEVRTFKTNNELRDDILMLIKNSVWKESKGVADWVIVSDLDELIYHKRLTRKLSQFKAEGITIPNVEGFNMISDIYPKQGIDITLQVRRGAASKAFSKSIIFDPNKIEEINYGAGAHFMDPVGQICFGGYLKLLHYKYLGSKERLQSRWTAMGDSLSKVNIDNKWAIERRNPEIVLDRIEMVRLNSELVIDQSWYEWRTRLVKLFKKKEPLP